MERITLALDSQQLTAYERCPRSYWYSHVKSIETKQERKALNIGSVVHDLFEYVNRGLIAGKESLGMLVLDALRSEAESLEKLSPEEKTFILKRFSEYYKHWEVDNKRYQLISAEKGFSKIIYEDNNYLFVYEGRLDAMFYDKKDDQFNWWDYKTHTGNYTLYKHCNQFYGYTWALMDEGTSCGTIDYIGKQKEKTDKTFFREQVKFSPSQIARWKERAVRTYFNIVNDTNFHQNTTACEGKYGLCAYTMLCERDPEIQDQLIQIYYKEREKVWTAW